MSKLLWAALGIPLVLCAQSSSSNAPEPTFEKPGYESPLPVRVELGTYHYGTTNNYGYWRGFDGSIFLRYSNKFIPVITFDRQTRDQGTQQNIAFFSYANWSRSFYTTQGVSYAPPGTSATAIYFPRIRYDVRGWYKTPFNRNLILCTGISYYDYTGPQSGEIVTTGVVYYHRKWVTQADLYLNRSMPGNFYSGAGMVSVQYGREGKYWVGGSIGGGKEVYRYISNINSPVDVNLSSISTQAFFRKWINRNTGFVLLLDQQSRVNAYKRFGVQGRVFFEF